VIDQSLEPPTTLLEVEAVKKYFPIHAGLLRRRIGDVKAVDEVTFSINRGETLGLVGESGSGKTTLGRVIAGAYVATGGTVRLSDQDERHIDLGSLNRTEMRSYLAKVQMIFQDPYSSLNPRRTAKQIIEDPLICLTAMGADERNDRVHELLEIVGLDKRHAERYPHAFSGGQRQRIGIARALSVDPSLVVCDEAVSALDVSVQGQIINLLMDLREERGLAYLFVSHDLGVVKHISDRIAVMYVGKLVEVASPERLFATPKHPYTEALLAAVPRPDPSVSIDDPTLALESDVADPADRPTGCAFHPRCRYAQSICSAEEPPLVDIGKNGDTHQVACHFAEELDLSGIID